MLTEAGYVFEAANPPFEDPDQPEQPKDVLALVERLACRKATSLRGTLPEDASGQLILAADTLCVESGGKVVGKPADQRDALAMLKRLSESWQHVITGVCLLDVETGRQQSFTDTATVRCGRVNEEALERYAESDQWQGKAGGYNLTDRQADGWPMHVVGDATTVVGLPMRRLGQALETWGVLPGTQVAAR